MDKPLKNKVLRVGTRTSPMAQAQTRRVIREVSAHHPEIRFEICDILSSGDKDKTTPIWQMGEVGVFSRELDEQVLSGQVDCAVHSFKDLGTERPKGLQVAALLKRDNVRDVILFASDILDRIQRGDEIIIGTSSPRRTTLLPEFLSDALPQLGVDKPVVRCVPVRGNANTRIEKLIRGVDGLSGIALAFAGLSRLYADAQTQGDLMQLLAGLKWMVMPLTVCPTAPGQGVICVEAAANRPDVLDIFACVHDVDTARTVEDERKILRDHGGGCHQKFGATKMNIPNLNQSLMLMRGLNVNNQSIDEDRWESPPHIENAIVWDGKGWSDKIFKAEKIVTQNVSAEAAFVAHARAVPDDIAPEMRLWVSGVASWKKLAEKGLWVEGCADGFGFDFIRDTLLEPVLNLPKLKSWAIYTHAQAAAQWTQGHVVPTYKLVPANDDQAAAQLQKANVAWWVSDTQYAHFATYAGHIKLHACGAGRTATLLKEKNIGPLAVFPSYDAFKRWLNDE